MFTRKFALIVAAASFLGAGAAQASVFPGAAEVSGFGPSVNAPLPANTNAVDLSVRNTTIPLDTEDRRYNGSRTDRTEPARIIQGESYNSGSSAFPSKSDSD